MAIDFTSPKAKRWIIATVALASMVAYCAPPGTFRHIDFELTGTVRDKETKEPIEGAYVVAVYLIRESGLAATSFNCKKTKGAYTDKDGKYHLPVEKLDGLSPHDVAAIKPGYYGTDREIPTIKQQRAQNADTYSNRDHYLVKQNPDKPEFRFGFSLLGCTFAETREDVAASIQFKKIELAEVKRLAGENWLIENVSRGIARLEALPSNKK